MPQFCVTANVRMRIEAKTFLQAQLAAEQELGCADYVIGLDVVACEEQDEPAEAEAA